MGVGRARHDSEGQAMSVFGSGSTVADVAVDLTVETVDEQGVLHHIDAVLGYRRSDPYAVTMTFLTATGNLTWTYGRDLLVVGLHAPTGQGDVQVAPAIGPSGRAVVLIELTSPDGHLVLQARTDEVGDFIARTVEVVPVGEESAHVDVDALISRLIDA